MSKVPKKKKGKRKPSRVDPDRHMAFVLLRYRRRMNQAEFSREADIAPGLLSLYDQGKQTVPDPAMERAARAGDVQPFLLPPLVRGLRSFRLAAEGWRRLRRIPADLAFADLLALAGSAVEVVLDVAGERAVPRLALPSAGDRAAVPELWDRLARHGPSERLVLVEEDEEFQVWALCERVAAESIALAPRSPAEALELARLASRIAELYGGEPAFRLRLQGFADIHLANALRITQDVPQAGETFEQGKKLWEDGAPGDPGLLSEAVVLALEANLRLAQRRFREALASIGESLAADRGDLRGKHLLIKSQILEVLGETEASTAVLEEAIPWIDVKQDPRTALGVRFQFLVNLCREGRAAEAEPGLPQVHALAERSGKEMDLVRVVWLAAKIDAGVGRFRKAEAEAAFRHVQGEFRTRELAYDYALVSLDLALLLLEQGRTAEVRVLSEEMTWIFRAEGIGREALAAIRLYCDAARRERATVELTRQVVRFLDRVQYDPSLRFEA